MDNLYGINFINMIKSSIQNARDVAGQTEILTRCPFCGDSTNPRNAHFYISVPSNEDEVSFYDCKKCPAHGILNDEVLRKQREIIYSQRKDILFLDDVEPIIIRMFKSVVTRLIPQYRDPESKQGIVDSDRLMKEFCMKFFNINDIEEFEFNGMKIDEVEDLNSGRNIYQFSSLRTSPVIHLHHRTASYL